MASKYKQTAAAGWLAPHCDLRFASATRIQEQCKRYANSLNLDFLSQVSRRASEITNAPIEVVTHITAGE